jgi:hypothetical protein
MAGSNFNDPKSNDLARSAGDKRTSGGYGSPSDSENNPTFRPEDGVGGDGGSDQATPEAKRAGYGYSFQAEGVSASGGHNIDSRNQYTVKMPRGSSL